MSWLLGKLGLSGLQFGIMVALFGTVVFMGWRLSAVSSKLGAEREHSKTLQAQVDVLNQDIKLRDEAAKQRAKDNKKAADQTEELTDARDHSGDTAGAIRLRTLCIKLRQQSPSRFDSTAACQRFAGAAGAAHP